MKRSIEKTVMGMFAALMLLFGGVANANEIEEWRYIDFSKETPSAVLEFKVSSAKLLLGVSWGKGNLYYDGEIFPVKVSGISAGGLGFQKMSGVGEVYFLDSLNDLPGTYRGGVIGATVVKGKGVATIENSRNVVIRINGSSNGLALNASTGGLNIEFIK